VVGGAVSMSDALQAVEFAGENDGSGNPPPIASISAAFSGPLRCSVVCSSLRLSFASCFLLFVVMAQGWVSCVSLAPARFL
jgi:hypothetical protein